MKLEPFKVLSDDEIRSIHEATVEILSGCGVKIDHPQMLEDLAGLGVEVDREAGVARFSRTCIEEQIARVPSTIEVFDRRGEAAFVIGEGRPKIAAGHNAVFWLDSETGETRSSKIEDVRRFSRICQRLEAIDLIGIPVMPQDVDSAEASLLEGVRAAAENSTKPIYFSTDSARVNRGCIDLLEAAFEGDFSRQVYAISQVSPTAPLFWERGVIDAIRDTVTTAVPLAILPEPNAGVSAPYTLAGLVTVNNAEAISGLVMIQLLRGGAGCLYANSWTTTDMRTGSALVGSTETSICRIAGAQMGRF
jgi:trimethylamine--corrinoid protein Co-methyltransferase